MDLTGARATPEYQAAWDLEVWKAEEKQRFQKRLERERLSLGKKLDAELARRERSRAEEFEREKEKVAQLSLRVSKTLEALQDREDRLSAREAELNRRKTDMAVEHERKLREMEERIRQHTEEAFFNTEALDARNKELTEENGLLQARHERLLRDHDALCTEYAAYKRDHVLGGEATKLRLELRRVRDEASGAVSERDGYRLKYDEARAVAQRHKNKIKHLAAEYNKLLALAQRQRVESLEHEKALVRRAQAMHEASLLRQLGAERDNAARSVAAAGASGAAPGLPSDGAHDSFGLYSTYLHAGSSELKAMLEEAEVAESGAAAAEKAEKLALAASSRRRQRERRSARAAAESLSTAPTPNDVYVSDDAEAEASDSGSEEAGMPLVVDYDATQHGVDAASSLKREIANRNRLLSTGVMKEDDSYIQQLSESIADKCRQLGLSEADIA